VAWAASWAAASPDLEKSKNSVTDAFWGMAGAFSGLAAMTAGAERGSFFAVVVGLGLIAFGAAKMFLAGIKVES